MDGEGEEDYEALRLANIRENAELLRKLGLDKEGVRLRSPSPERPAAQPRKRRAPATKSDENGDTSTDALPARKSSRIASAGQRSYRERDLQTNISRKKPEKVYREGSRRSGRGNEGGSGKRKTYTDWDTDDDADNSDDFLPPRNRDSSAEAEGSSRPYELKKLRNPPLPAETDVGDDDDDDGISPVRAPLPKRKEMPPGTGRGHLIFERPYQNFTPNVTPEEMLRGGAFGGTSFRAYHSRLLNRKLDVKAELAELPPEWLQGLDVDNLLRQKEYDPKKNKFGVKAGQTLEEWEKAGWTRPQDPRGWWQWYYRFYLGRRSRDDGRQISRWFKACGPGGRFKKSLVQNVARSGGGWDDPTVNPVVRQTLWHWGYDLTLDDYRAYLPRD